MIGPIVFVDCLVRYCSKHLFTHGHLTTCLPYALLSLRYDIMNLGMNGIDYWPNLTVCACNAECMCGSKQRKTPYILSTAGCPQKIWIPTKPLTIYLPSTKLRGSLGKEGHMWIPKWKKLLYLLVYLVLTKYQTTIQQQQAAQLRSPTIMEWTTSEWVPSLSNLYRIQDIHKKLECVRTKYSFLITSIQLLNSSIIFVLKIVSLILWIYI